jgi:hypothetical protein
MEEKPRTRLRVKRIILFFIKKDRLRKEFVK